jgi:FHA domain
MQPTAASLVIHEGAGAGSEHPVDGELILGREQTSADLVIPDPGISRRHARVLPQNGGVIVEDLGSSNGTYVNGERISGPVEIGTGDEVQLGDTVLGVQGTGTADTALMPPGAPATEHHLAPPPHQPSNIPALAALFLGPLSILLVFLSTGGFFLALPSGIAAIVLGTIGIRNADRRQLGHRGLARIGRITGWIGTLLSILAVIVFIAVATALHTTESSVSGLIDRIRDEIDKVDVPDVNPPDVNSPNAPNSGGGNDNGGTAAPTQ